MTSPGVWEVSLVAIRRTNMKTMFHLGQTEHIVRFATTLLATETVPSLNLAAASSSKKIEG